jgi:hypothetical protein
MAEAASPKLGAGDWRLQTPVRYPNVYALEQTTGPPRLIIGPAGDHVEVLLSLAEVWGKDYYLLYVLLVPRQGKRKPGRYQSPGPLSFEQVAAFCRHFGPFLQGDGRHHLWVGSTVNAGLLIYDQHEWIWAYGDLSAYIRMLQSRGFKEGAVSLPAPHSHNYNSEFDAAEDDLAGYWKWAHFPLQPDDEY